VLVAGAATGQTPKAPRRIAFLMPSTRKFSEPQFDAFRARLKELGYSEGRDVVIEARWADGSVERLSVLARELLDLNPAVIVASTQDAATAAKRLTSVVPIVFIAVDDPVAAGFAASLARPAGNMTGITFRAASMSEKMRELVREAMPERKKIAVLVQEHPVMRQNLPLYRGNLAKEGFDSEFIFVRDERDFTSAFEQIARWRADVLWVSPAPFFVSHAGQINKLAADARLPVVGTRRAFTDAGGLLSYDNDLKEDYRRAAGYVDRILKGAKPGDLPIDQPERFHLSVNLRAAKNLGIKIPQKILLRADQVIE